MGTFFVFWIKKALGMVVLIKTQLLPQNLLFALNQLAVFRISFKSIRNCFKAFNGFVTSLNYCRKAEIKKRGTRLIDLTKNQNYQ